MNRNYIHDDDDDGVNDDLENARRLFGVVWKISAVFLLVVGLWCASKVIA